MEKDTAESPQNNMVADAFKKSANMSILLGVLCIIAGFLAIVSPFVAGTATTVFVGCLILASGILELFGVFRAENWKAGSLAFLSGGLSILCGAILLARPLFGLSVLTMLLVVYFLVDGIGKIFLAFKIKPESGWGWVLFGGIITTLLALLIWRQWPLSGLWAIGTLVGINILFSGWTMVAVGLAAKNLPAPEAQPDS